MLSLSPRYDLFRFSLPKDFLPDTVIEKYSNIINKNAAVITTSKIIGFNPRIINLRGI